MWGEGTARAFEWGVPYSREGLSLREGCGPGSHSPQLCLSKDPAISPPALPWCDHFRSRSRQRQSELRQNE